MSDNNSVEKLNELVKDIKFTMLVTQSPDGTLRSRPMTTQDFEFDGDLWFFSSDVSEPVQDILKNPSVNVAYEAPNKQLYVSVSGQAEVVRDRAKMKEYWTPVYKLFFPDGLDDPSLVLLKINVESAEYWDSGNWVVRQLKFVKAVIHGHMDENEDKGSLKFR
jgi:general stress protein 26